MGPADACRAESRLGGLAGPFDYAQGKLSA